NFSIKRNQTLVGKVLNLSNKKLRPIYYDGGSQSRDYFISMRFTEINDGILYNYRYGKEFFLINEQKDLKLLTFDSKDLLTNDFIQEVDNMIPHKAADVFNDQYRKNNKIDNFHFYYMHNNIFFFTTFWNNNFYWVFYNSVKDQYKTMKFQPMTIYTHKGVPFKPYVKNAKDNYFMVFLDGQEMQQTNSNIEFNSNSPYFIKIYPKYLNQEAWE
ncbi:MAG TPA: hypothetical protein PKD85_17590, partial [Saprospiraceae bacterium]|nr:hypothetical protein [Saprospiraceae bacterium]